MPRSKKATAAAKAKKVKAAEESAAAEDSIQDTSADMTEDLPMEGEEVEAADEAEEMPAADEEDVAATEEEVAAAEEEEAVTTTEEEKPAAAAAPVTVDPAVELEDDKKELNFAPAQEAFEKDCKTACFYQTVEISPIDADVMAGELMTNLMKQCVHFQTTARLTGDGGYEGKLLLQFRKHTDLLKALPELKEGLGESVKVSPWHTQEDPPIVGIGSVDDLKEFLCFYNIGDGVSEEEMHAAFPDHEIITAWFKKERQFKGYFYVKCKSPEEAKEKLDIFQTNPVKFNDVDTMVSVLGIQIPNRLLPFDERVGLFDKLKKLQEQKKSDTISEQKKRLLELEILQVKERLTADKGRKINKVQQRMAAGKRSADGGMGGGPNKWARGGGPGGRGGRGAPRGGQRGGYGGGAGGGYRGGRGGGNMYGGYGGYGGGGYGGGGYGGGYDNYGGGGYGWY